MGERVERLEAHPGLEEARRVGQCRDTRAMMFRAEDWGLRERGSNPRLGIAKSPRNRVRFLDEAELARLGHALDDGEAEWPEAVATNRLLAPTGCGRNEVLNLCWRDIGEDAINLPDSKTDPRQCCR